MSKVTKVVKKSKARSNIFSREDVIDWKKLEETLKDLTFNDTFKKDTSKK